MKQLSIKLIAVIVLSCLFSSSAFSAGYAGTFVQGGFCSYATNGGPAPGLTVSLVHPNLGRSAPAYTDAYGNFFMGNIPFDSQPYYIEVYWGNQLVFRDHIYVVNGPVSLPRVCL